MPTLLVPDLLNLQKADDEKKSIKKGDNNKKEIEIKSPEVKTLLRFCQGPVVDQEDTTARELALLYVSSYVL